MQRLNGCTILNIHLCAHILKNSRERPLKSEQQHRKSEKTFVHLCNPRHISQKGIIWHPGVRKCCKSTWTHRTLKNDFPTPKIGPPEEHLNAQIRGALFYCAVTLDHCQSVGNQPSLVKHHHFMTFYHVNARHSFKNLVFL